MSKKKIIVKNELSSLDKAIDYVKDQTVDRNYQYHDPNIIGALFKIHSGQQSAYEEFLRVAWGKGVRINSEYKGEIIYRLSQSAAIIPGLDIATPQSPIGRLVNIARSGDIYESAALGEYTIDDVWYFERYVAHEYLENIKNFKKMTSRGENNFSIKNLLGWLKNFDRTKLPVKDEIEKEGTEISLWDNVTFDDAMEDEVVDEPSEIEDDQKAISLSTGFYVNLSKNQYDATHSGANGLVFVFGVAGSGKTSVALGRSKSLSQLGQLPKDDKLYNQDFPEETQIGIVRTGELITYLKDTCNMLSLHRLPVVEYRDIYEELKTHWDIEQSKRNNAPKYFLAKKNEVNGIDSEIKWFTFISESMIAIISERILTFINKPQKDIASIDGDIFARINKDIIASIQYTLKKNNPIEYLYRLDNSLDKVIKKIFNQSIWVGIPADDEISWLINKEDDVATQILQQKRVLCLFGGVRNIQILIPETEKDLWQEWIPSDALVSQQNTEIPSCISIPTTSNNTIEINIIIVSKETISHYAKKGTLRFYEGVGVRTNTVKTKRLWLAHMPKIVSTKEHQEGSEKNTREWRKQIRGRVLYNIKSSISSIRPADLFSEAIERLSGNDKVNSEYTSILKLKHMQIKDKKLTEQDIDLLIAFMASITRTQTDSLFSDVSGLKPAPYRSSVFIDEVQDFSEIQVYLLSLLSNPKYNSVTAVGDSAQCLYTTTSDISVSFPKSMWEISRRQELTENIRQQNIPTINALSATFRNEYIDDVIINIDEYKKNENLDAFHRTTNIEQLKQAFKILSNIPKSETIVIVVPSVEHAKEAISQLKPHLRERQHRECNYSRTIDLSKRYVAHVTTPKNIKGLEFDHLIALYLDEYDLNNAINKSSIYVMMSRPKKSLSLIANIDKMDVNFTKIIKKFADIQIKKT